MTQRDSAKNILDDKNAILALDRTGLFKDESQFSENLMRAIDNVKAFKLPDKVSVRRRVIRYDDVKNVVFAGMGGSAIVGDLIRDWAEDKVKVPLETVRGYHLPAYADKDTLVFLISYSGNTEETLSCMLDAVNDCCKIVSISSNGALKRASDAISVPLIGVPKMAAARASLPYLFAPLPYLLAELKILPIEMVAKEVNSAKNMVSELTREFAIDVPFEKNRAKKLAYQMFGTVPIIYSYSPYRSVGLRFKTQINENCKLPARFDTFPELNHNEIMGWEASKQIIKHYTVILLRSRDEPQEVKTRIDALKEKFFEKKARSVIELEAQGETLLARMFNLLFTADMTSMYLSVLHRRDPVASEAFQLLKYEVTERLQSLEKLEQQILKLASG